MCRHEMKPALPRKLIGRADPRSPISAHVNPSALMHQICSTRSSLTSLIGGRSARYDERLFGASFSAFARGAGTSQVPPSEGAFAGVRTRHGGLQRFCVMGRAGIEPATL